MNKGAFDGENSSLGIALRENNARRRFLICNKLQAKHIPADPKVTLDYFGELGNLAAGRHQGERTLVVGFAETATAVGAVVADRLCRARSDVVYCHTSREPLPREALVAEFLEEHSHAVNQALYLDGFDIREFGRIVFVEDEVTTGRTILNFLAVLREKKLLAEGVRITVAALVFGDIDKTKFDRYDVDFCCLARVDTSALSIPEAEGAAVETRFYDGACDAPPETRLPGMMDPRLGVRLTEYKARCAKFAGDAAALVDVWGKDVLVIGAEEFMYPALLVASKAAESAASVKCHSTTRTPIVPLSLPNYPITERIALRSLYDVERRTYLYNLASYDSVIVVTDAKELSGGERGLYRALRDWGNTDVHLARWI
jgi:orotate phosphoribosyltransferase